jgi:hypothetical protein
MGPRPPGAEMGHDAVASGRCVNELSGALWTVCGVVPGYLHTVRGYCYWLVAGVATPPRERQPPRPRLDDLSSLISEPGPK